MRIIGIFWLICFTFSGIAWADSNYSIYLVRHAEKQQEGDDPSLSPCGKARATQLASLLAHTKIEKIYSSPYQRTRQTASPLAIKLNIAIQNYNPKYLEQLAIMLQQRKENTLVVGHSNTTSQLAEILAKQKITPLTEFDFQQLYQIQFIAGYRVVTLLQQPLTCD